MLCRQEPIVAGLADRFVVKDRPQKSAVREAVVRFLVSSVVAFLVLMLATLLLGARIARQEALRDARVRGASIGNLIAAPLVNVKLRTRVRGTGSTLPAVLPNRSRAGSHVHPPVRHKGGAVIGVVPVWSVVGWVRWRALWARAR